MKNLEERFESLERTVRMYRILIIVLALIIFWSQGERIVGWMKSVDSWVSAIGNARA